MWDDPYPYINIGKHHSPQNGIEPKETIIFKFNAETRTYISKLEIYSFGFAAIKFCDRRDIKNKRNAYTRIFNDAGIPNRVITTNVFIMWDYYIKYPHMSFCFYASPRTPEQVFNGRIDRNVQARFSIYQYAVKSKFDPRYFEHLEDQKHNLYLLMSLGLKQREEKLQSFLAYIDRNHPLLFD